MKITTRNWFQTARKEYVGFRNTSLHTSCVTKRQFSCSKKYISVEDIGIVPLLSAVFFSWRGKICRIIEKQGATLTIKIWDLYCMICGLNLQKNEHFQGFFYIGDRDT